jgi:hypothetical protein
MHQIMFKNTHILLLVTSIMLNRRVPTIIVPMNLNSLNALYEQREDEGEYFMFSIGREDLTILFEAGFF